MQDAPKHLKEQLIDIHAWLARLGERLYVCEQALECDIISLNDMPEKISEFRSSLYEIDKSLEILSTNCVSLVETQNKESDDERGNRNQSEQTSSAPNGQGSKD